MDPESGEKLEAKGNEDAPASSRSAHVQRLSHEWLEQHGAEQHAPVQQHTASQPAGATQQAPAVQGPQAPSGPPAGGGDGAAADLLKLLADILDRMNRGSDLSDAAKDAVARYLALRSTLAHR